MKKLTIILLVVLIGNFISCKSPLDVDANRISNIKLIPTTNTKYLKINDDLLDFGLVNKGDQRSVSLMLMNESDTPIRIDSAVFSNDPTTFTIDEEMFPFILDPRGKDKSSKIIEIKFDAEKTGLYSNKLHFNKYPLPSIDMISIVPSVYTTDIDFGEIHVGYITAKTLTVTNHSRQQVTIRDFVFDDRNRAFNLISQMPIRIAPGLKKHIIIGFHPRDSIKYETRIKFIIEGGDGYKDGNSSIKGEGVYR